MTRDEILTAAAQIFSEKGFHAASMQDIAEAVNLQKASLYHHISSKQEILLAILDRALDLLIEDIEQVVEQPFSPDEKLRLAMAVYLQDMLEHRDLAVVLLLEHRSLEPQYHARHMLRRDRFEHLWREVILQGAEQGTFHCADASLASRYILGVMNWAIIWYRPDGLLTPVEIADQFAVLFLEGLLVRKV
jgi:AcrR family transcriptional regulator